MFKSADYYTGAFHEKTLKSSKIALLLLDRFKLNILSNISYVTPIKEFV